MVIGLGTLTWLVLVMALGCGAEDGTLPPVVGQTEIQGKAGPSDIALTTPLVSDLRVELPASEPVVHLVWGGETLAQQHHLLDLCARAGDRAADKFCAMLDWRAASELDTALDRYLDIRRRWIQAAKEARAAVEAGGDQMFVDMLPPAEPQVAEAFALAFMRAHTRDEAVAALKLKEPDALELTAALASILPHANPKPHLEAATRRLQAMAQGTNVESYLGHLARFYGVESRLPAEFVVNVFDSSGLSLRATVYAEQIVLPLSDEYASSEERVQSTLGVVVHELGHAFMAQVPDDVRRRVSDTLVHRCGSFQRTHYNIFDEATQVAAGNVLFMNAAFPGTVQDDQFLYNYERDNPEPQAIDQLGRFLSPVLLRHLATPGAFAEGFLEEAIAAQEEAFGNAPRNHTRVARLVAGDTDGRLLRRSFEDLFWGTSRESMGIDAFLESDAKANPGLTRWVLLSGDSRSADAKRLSTTLPLALEVEMKLGDRAACFRAERRGKARGYDMVVVGQNVASVRDMLIHIHQMSAVPGQTVCLSRRGPTDRSDTDKRGRTSARG